MDQQAIDRAWAAGLFEGEGCLTIGGTKHPQARMKLRCTDRDVVARFHAIMPVGRMRDEPDQLKHGYKMQWEWYVSSQDDVLAAINFLRPFLGERRTARANELVAHIAVRKAAAKARRER